MSAFSLLPTWNDLSESAVCSCDLELQPAHTHKSPSSSFSYNLFLESLAASNIPSASAGLYALARTDEALEIRCPSVGLYRQLRMNTCGIAVTHRLNLDISSYIVLTRSMTGLTLFRCSYTSKTSKSPGGKFDSVSGPTS
jgi:hypothetical protein